MDTSSCVMGIERFAARRGVPSVLWADNGNNFIASEKELLQNASAWNQQILSEALVKKRIHWKFNPPSAPHHGGVWERIVRSFKHVFYAILGNRRLTDEILTTTFCLVEQSLNSRPLVPVSSDATDLDALTPNHFREFFGNREFHTAIAPESRRRPQETLRASASVLRCNLGSLVKRLRSVA